MHCREAYRLDGYQLECPATAPNLLNKKVFPLDMHFSETSVISPNVILFFLIAARAKCGTDCADLYLAVSDSRRGKLLTQESR
mmetsp:Transcript_5940/g.10780  ORF Transcript_5940/g.10780 Transcript_5940/m.10780 type:complete len:83 (-) Transcript_5940:1347-1595(-)